MELMTLHEMHARHLRALRRSPETVRFYRQAVLDLERFMQSQGMDPKAELVTRAVLIECQGAMQARDLKPGAVHAFMRGLRALFRWAVDEDLITRDPTLKLKLPSIGGDVPPAIQPDEVSRCLKAVQGMPFPARNTAILMLMYDTGLRLGEVIGLNSDDVDMTAGVMRVRAETSKVDAQRTVPLGIKSAKALAKYERLERRPLLPHVPTLFIARGGAPLTKSGLSQLLNRVAEEAGLPRDHVAPHAWRRGFAVQYLRNGGDMFSLQQILGHTDLSMTRRYVKYLPNDIQVQHLRASPADRL
ncbi:tyrosine-type recombinase/integrase [Deinococcus sp. MIMF12]|uniref:Tyrosine-type recombinase/integrase n=1 Tax=Deinococcus rhizophilus TaxID=3049544 RepID=A0ABT7JD48_9DEIO|nr:tyrosine-type recombinase/integrase [Deinococcus rhizophilus]MDL2342970.1 tyrosine-type recombinase/integrase [Deinococcus rhizophilus]